MKLVIKLPLLIFVIFLKSYSSIAQTKVPLENPSYFLTNAWIVEKITLNDSIISMNNCITFFHKEGKCGSYCMETNTLTIDGNWKITDAELVVKGAKEARNYNILNIETNLMLLEYFVGLNKIQLYCILKI